ncbi:MAG: hypothetical protein A2Z34_06735 [Planctomycetes bacterium RBG_16_59_8]|nr:MAG: hypothetical protein A2Z34_06735 [Planctomycetes bacterium RBG_16_59_8]
MLYTVESRKPVATICEDLAKACAEEKFGLLAVYDLMEKMREKGIEFGGECVIFEVCNPLKALQMLEKNPELSTVLPCRIAVFRASDGRMRISAIRPTALMEFYGSVDLQGAAAEVEKTLKKIVDRAAR